MAKSVIKDGIKTLPLTYALGQALCSRALCPWFQELFLVRNHLQLPLLHAFGQLRKTWLNTYAGTDQYTQSSRGEDRVW